MTVVLICLVVGGGMYVSWYIVPLLTWRIVLAGLSVALCEFNWPCERPA